MSETISKASVCEILADIYPTDGEKVVAVKEVDKAYEAIQQLPSAQPDLTDEQAIEHLQASGWMQSHDKQMYEMGLKERLADDSDSYDALLPSAQPTDAEIQKMQDLEQAEIQKAYELGKLDAMDELIRCKDCRKHNVNVGYKEDCCPMYEYRGISYGHEHDFQYCSSAERREE